MRYNLFQFITFCNQAILYLSITTLNVYNPMTNFNAFRCRNEIHQNPAAIGFCLLVKY